MNVYEYKGTGLKKYNPKTSLLYGCRFNNKFIKDIDFVEFERDVKSGFTIKKLCNKYNLSHSVCFRLRRAFLKY